MNTPHPDTAESRRAEIERYLESESERLAPPEDDVTLRAGALGVAIWMIEHLLRGGEAAEYAREDFEKWMEGAAEPAPLLNAETAMSGRMNEEEK